MRNKGSACTVCPPQVHLLPFSALLCAQRVTLQMTVFGLTCQLDSGWVWPMEGAWDWRAQEREVRVYYFLLRQWLHPSRSSPFPVTPALTELLCHHFLLLLSSPKDDKATLCWFLGAPSPLVDSLISTHTSVNIFFIKGFSFEPAELNSLPTKIPTGT